MGGRVPLFGRNSLPVRSAENAVSQPFTSPCGFRMRRGERRPAMLSQFENLMIFLFRKYQSVPYCFLSFRKVAHADRGRMVSSEWRMGTPNGRFAIRL
jgi:hypothetical protein